MPKIEQGLLKRDAKRDLGAELLESVRQMKAGKRAAVHRVDVPQIVQARMDAGLSQGQFAKLMGVSVRTAAHTLLRIAAKHAEVIRDNAENITY